MRVLSCSFVSRDGTLVSCFSCIGRQILYHWATCKAIWYTYSISYVERSVYPTVVSLSSPALPLAVQLWQALLALIDQFLSVLFLTLILEDICLALEAGSRHLTGISFSSCPTFSLSHATPEHSVKIHGKELVSEEDLFCGWGSWNFILTYMPTQDHGKCVKSVCTFS